MGKTRFKPGYIAEQYLYVYAGVTKSVQSSMQLDLIDCLATLKAVRLRQNISRYFTSRQQLDKATQLIVCSNLSV